MLRISQAAGRLYLLPRKSGSPLKTCLFRLFPKFGLAFSTNCPRREIGNIRDCRYTNLSCNANAEVSVAKSKRDKLLRAVCSNQSGNDQHCNGENWGLV